MKAADWYAITEICFGIGGILFFVGVVAGLYGSSLGIETYRDLGIVGVLSSLFLFIIAYVSYQRFKEEEKVENQ